MDVDEVGAPPADDVLQLAQGPIRSACAETADLESRVLQLGAQIGRVSGEVRHPVFKPLMVTTQHRTDDEAFGPAASEPLDEHQDAVAP